MQENKIVCRKHFDNVFLEKSSDLRVFSASKTFKIKSVQASKPYFNFLNCKSTLLYTSVGVTDR